MQEAFEETFGKDYNVLPIWKQRFSAKTQVTTPNSEVMYAQNFSKQWSYQILGTPAPYPCSIYRALGP